MDGLESTTIQARPDKISDLKATAYQAAEDGQTEVLIAKLTELKQYYEKQNLSENQMYYTFTWLECVTVALTENHVKTVKHLLDTKTTFYPSAEEIKNSQANIIESLISTLDYYTKPEQKTAKRTYTPYISMILVIICYFMHIAGPEIFLLIPDKYTEAFGQMLLSVLTHILKQSSANPTENKQKNIIIAKYCVNSLRHLKTTPTPTPIYKAFGEALYAAKVNFCAKTKNRLQFLASIYPNIVNFFIPIPHSERQFKPLIYAAFSPGEPHISLFRFLLKDLNANVNVRACCEDNISWRLLDYFFHQQRKDVRSQVCFCLLLLSRVDISAATPLMYEALREERKELEKVLIKYIYVNCKNENMSLAEARQLILKAMSPKESYLGTLFNRRRLTFLDSNTQLELSQFLADLHQYMETGTPIQRQPIYSPHAPTTADHVTMEMRQFRTRPDHTTQSTGISTARITGPTHS